VDYSATPRGLGICVANDGIQRTDGIPKFAAAVYYMRVSYPIGLDENGGGWLMAGASECYRMRDWC